jgi:hypothetical protein
MFLLGGTGHSWGVLSWGGPVPGWFLLEGLVLSGGEGGVFLGDSFGGMESGQQNYGRLM